MAKQKWTKHEEQTLLFIDGLMKTNISKDAVDNLIDLYQRGLNTAEEAYGLGVTMVPQTGESVSHRIEFLQECLKMLKSRAREL